MLLPKYNFNIVSLAPSQFVLEREEGDKVVYAITDICRKVVIGEAEQVNLSHGNNFEVRDINGVVIGYAFDLYESTFKLGQHIKDEINVYDVSSMYPATITPDEAKKQLNTVYGKFTGGFVKG